MQNFIESEDDYSRIYVKKPEKCIDLPEIDQNELCAPLRKTSEEGVIEYFQYLNNGELRIQMVNGVPISEMYPDTLDCDYCNTCIIEHNGRNPYYYCMQCHKDMCNLCHSETSSEIAEANGSKNYEKRREALAKCKAHNLEKRDFLIGYDCGECSCDVCSKSLSDTTSFWSDVGKVKSVMSRQDCCSQCATTEKGIKLITERGMEEFDRQELAEKMWATTLFGSMMDWVPVLEYEGDSVLFNYNSQSPYVGKYALVAEDDHGRMGYYTLDWPLAQIRATLINYVKNPLKDENGDDLEGWDAHYNNPIKRIMTLLNMPVHFG